jgi:hypothetical protein
MKASEIEAKIAAAEEGVERLRRISRRVTG